MQAKGPTRGQCNSSTSSTSSERPDFPAPRRLFALGLVLATPGAVAFLAAESVGVAGLLARHQSGDWGDLCAEDQAANARALVDGTRIFSSYAVATGKVWIITEADRSSTTILLPDEY